MAKDLIEIFDEEYEKRRLITPKNTAEKMTAKGYQKQSEGEWMQDFDGDYYCSKCAHYPKEIREYCPNCGAHMKGGAE